MRLFYIFCFLQLVTYSNAQIVNIENKRFNLKTDTSGWFGSIDAGFSLNENGKTVMSFTGNANLEYLSRKNLWISLTNYRFLNIDNQSFVNSGFQHLRYNRQLKPKLTWEGFAQIQYNEQLRIRLRGLIGTGPRFQVFNKKVGQAFLGTMYMFQYEELNSNDIIHREHRISAYFRIGLNFSNNSKIYSTSYYQPILTDPKTARFSSQTTLNIKISSNLSFITAFSISSDSRLSDEAGVPVTTYSLVNGLKWKF